MHFRSLLQRLMIPALAAGWLCVQQWGSVQAAGLIAFLILSALMMFPPQRRYPPTAQVGMGILLLVLGAWILTLSSGIQGRAAFRLFIGGMLFLGLAFPLVYALGLPGGEQS